MRDVYSGESRRFAFVTFKQAEDAEKARQALNYEKIDGYEIRIAPKRNPSDFKTNSNIFVKNLAPETTTKDLDNHCAQFGKVISAIVRTEENGKSLGYGYVQFEDEAVANSAITAMDGTTLHGKKLSVTKFIP